MGAGNVRRSRQVAADWSLWDKSVEDVARGWVGVTGPTGGVADQLYLVQGGCGVELGDGLISNPPVQGRLAPSPWVVAVVMDLCAFRRLVACLTGGEDSGSQTPRHRGFHIWRWTYMTGVVVSSGRGNTSLTYHCCPSLTAAPYAQPEYQTPTSYADDYLTARPQTPNPQLHAHPHQCP